MLNNLKWRFAKSGLSVTWDAPLPTWYNRLFREMAQVYYYSASKSPKVFLQGVSPQLVELIKKYYSLNVDEYKVLNTERPITEKQEFKTSKDKYTIMFTGGKDSLHVLMHLLHEKKVKPENIQCIYIPNINKSESYYERSTVENVCRNAGVTYKIVDVSNSIKINREGHNIGLRDQLLVVLATPHIAQFGSKNVIFGLHSAFNDLHDSLYTSHSTAFELLSVYLGQLGLDIAVSPHPTRGISEISITRELIEKWPEYFWMTNSCYRQLNFRERQHKACQERHPDFKIYHGCGNCLKCLRINGILSLYESSGNYAARWNMAKEVNNTFVKKYPHDETLREVVKLLRADILERKHSDVSPKT